VGRVPRPRRAGGRGATPAVRGPASVTALLPEGSRAYAGA
jgi:hypothetical protein